MNNVAEAIGREQVTTHHGKPLSWRKTDSGEGGSEGCKMEKKIMIFYLHSL